METWPPRDRVGKKQPHRFGLMSWLRGLPGFGEQFTGEVPDGMWAADADEDGTPVAIIACTCGAEPKVRFNSTAECDGEGCGRIFAHFGHVIRVYRPAEPEPAAA